MLRAKGEILGEVEASDVASAKAAAVARFELDEIQRNRIMVQELADPAIARSPSFATIQCGNQTRRPHQAGGDLFW